MIRKPAENDYPIHDLLRDRWSPRAFADRPLTPEQILSLFEAVRWSASAFNGQPWRFVLAQRSDPDGFARMAACLNESNRRWAPSAPLLVLAVADRHFESDGRPPNRHYAYDLGLAVQNLTVQATSMGLIVHQIAGILPDVARQTYQIPDAYEIMTMIAIGYQGTLDDLNPHYHEREQRPRTRKALSELVFADSWGRASALTVSADGGGDA